METLQLEVQGHLTDELKLHESNSKRLSDENSLLGDKVVELGKCVDCSIPGEHSWNDYSLLLLGRVTSRRKQISSTEEKDAEIRELEKSCEQLRKVRIQASKTCCSISNHQESPVLECQ